MVGLADDAAICRLIYLRGRQPDVLKAEWQTEWSRTYFVEDKKAAADALRQLAAGDTVNILMVGTDFQRAVWKEIMRVPEGETISFGELADRAGRPRAARGAGHACKVTILSAIIPCHRIIAGDGSIGGWNTSLHLKTELLRAEGVDRLKAKARARWKNKKADKLWDDDFAPWKDGPSASANKKPPSTLA